MTGIAIAGIGIGAGIVPLLATRLLSLFGWRTAYIILGGGIFVIVFVAAQFLKRDPAQVGQFTDGDRETQGKGPGAIAGGFTLREALRARQFWLFFGMMFCLAFSFLAIQVHLVPYATDLALSPAAAAAILAALGGAGIIGRGVLGSIGDRIGNKKGFILGFTLMTLALLWLLVSQETWALYLFVVIFGLGYGNSSTQQSPLAAALFGLRSHGLIFATAGIGFTLGAGAGPFVAGYIFDMTGAYRMAFLAAAAMGAMGFVLNALLPVKQTKPT